MPKEDGEIKELGKKLAQNPDSMVFVQLADAYRRAGDLARSVEVCLQGLERHPSYATARVILGRDYLDLGKLDDAESEFRRIEAVDAENILAQRILGQIALRKGQYAEAISRQQRVLALDPDDATAQDLLQQALTQAKQSESGAQQPVPSGSGSPVAVPLATDAHAQALKVADIYIKKGVPRQAAEVVREILALDPNFPAALAKAKEIEALLAGVGTAKKSGVDSAEEEAKRKAEEEAKRKTEEEAKRKTEEEAKRKTEEEAKRKTEEEAKRKAEEEAKRKAEEEAKRKAEEEAKRKAEEEAKRKAEEEAKRKAEEEAKRKAEEEAKRKAEEEAKRKAEEEAKRKAEEEAKRKTEEEAKRKTEEEAKRKAEEEAKRKAGTKISAADILAAIGGSAEDLIENEAALGASKASVNGLAPELRSMIGEFTKAQGIEAGFLLDIGGVLLESFGSGDAKALAETTFSVFQNTAKAAYNGGFGALRQILITGADERQILFLALKCGILVAVTGRNTNVGLLRVAVHDLMKRA